jgi:hypothetical protein
MADSLQRRRSFREVQAHVSRHAVVPQISTARGLTAVGCMQRGSGISSRGSYCGRTLRVDMLLPSSRCKCVCPGDEAVCSHVKSEFCATGCPSQPPRCVQHPAVPGSRVWRVALLLCSHCLLFLFVSQVVLVITRPHFVCWRHIP